MNHSNAANDDNFAKMTFPFSAVIPDQNRLIMDSMMTSSNGNVFRVTGHLYGEFTGHQGQWRGALMFSLICVWINDWENNREAGDLRRYVAHYDVIVMYLSPSVNPWLSSSAHWHIESWWRICSSVNRVIAGSKRWPQLNADLLSIGSSGTNFNNIWIKIQWFVSTKIHFKMSSANYPPFCSDLVFPASKHYYPAHDVRNAMKSALMTGWMGARELAWTRCLYGWESLTTFSINVNIDIVWTRVVNCLCAQRLFWCSAPSCKATKEINCKITLESAHKKIVTRVHTSFYFLHNESINDDKNDDLHTSTPCLTRSFYVLLLMTSKWPDNYVRSMWEVISNSWDIDFIHGDIHGRSCEK